MEPGLETRFWVPRHQKGDQSGQDDGESAGSFRSVTFASTGKRKAIPHPKPSKMRCRKLCDGITPCSPFQQLKHGIFPNRALVVDNREGKEGIFPSALCIWQLHVESPAGALRRHPGQGPSTGCWEALVTLMACQCCCHTRLPPRCHPLLSVFANFFFTFIYLF